MAGRYRALVLWTLWAVPGSKELRIVSYLRIPKVPYPYRIRIVSTVSKSLLLESPFSRSRTPNRNQKRNFSP